MDLSEEALPIGTRVKIGSALLEITKEPHLGCPKFEKRFGKGAREASESEEGKRLRFRGVFAKVISDGLVKPGDRIAVTPLKQLE